MRLFKEKRIKKEFGNYFDIVIRKQFPYGVFDKHAELKVKLTRDNLKEVLREAEKLNIHIHPSKYIELIKVL